MVVWAKLRLMSEPPDPAKRDLGREMFKKSPRNIFKPPKVFNPKDLSNKPQTNNKPIIFKILKLIFLLLVILSLIYLFFYSPLFTIKNIIVDKKLPTSINEHLANIKGKNIFLVRSSEIKADLLKNFPELVDISVIRGLPDTIKVSYNERTPKIIWQSSGRYYIVDENGVAFKEIQGIADFPLVKDNNDLAINIGEQVVSTNFINFVTELRPKLKEQVEINRFEVNETTFQLDAILVSGLILKFDTTRSVDSQLNDLKKFLADRSNETQEYIDLRVEGKVFYK